MSDERKFQRNINWYVANGGGDLYRHSDGTQAYIQIALLQDIRAELREIRSVLKCANCLAIPHKLDQIARNTAKKRKKTT